MSRNAVVRARLSVSVVFAVHGAVVGNFATRIPWIAVRLHLGPGALGLALIAPALGSVLAMPLAARLTQRYGSRTIISILIFSWCLSLVPPVFAPDLPAFAAALLIYGAASGMSDVAMNAQGVVVEQRYGRSIMSGLHGMWSVGGLIGSAVGAWAAHAGIDARWHLSVAAVALGATGLAACTGLLDVRRPPGDKAPAFARPSRAVLLIALVGFCAVFAEGASADWCAVYLTSVTGAGPGVAGAAYTAFALAMAGGRLSGDQVVRRLGRVTCVRLGSAVATAGGTLVVLAWHPLAAIVGFGLIGLGIAVVVPLVFAAAGNAGSDPGYAIAGVATIAYGSGLAAPGAVGGIATLSSLPVSFAVITLLCAVMGVGAGALQPHRSRPRPRRTTTAPHALSLDTSADPPLDATADPSAPDRTGRLVPDADGHRVKRDMKHG